MFPTSASVGALLSTLLPVFALLRPARLLALLDRSDLERLRSPAAEDFLPELSRGRSPSPRVGYRYTAPGSGHRDRTFTGWSTAVTGCTFWHAKRKRIATDEFLEGTRARDKRAQDFQSWSAARHRVAASTRRRITGDLTSSRPPPIPPRTSNNTA